MDYLNKAKTVASGLLQNKKFLFILVAVLVFIGLAYYVYVYHISPKLNPAYVPNNEFVQEDGASETAELYLFYTEWCPHCKKAKPIWQKLKEEYDQKQVNGITVYFREVDCDKDEETAEKFGIEGYPTIKLIKGNQIIEYDAKPDYETLVEFLNTSL